MNRLLGSKLSIISPKAQTTRHQIVGVHSTDDCQAIFLDTPGVITPSYSLQKAMMKTVERARNDADLILFLCDPGDRHPQDDVLALLNSFRKPILLVLNKSDLYPAGSENEVRIRTLVESALNVARTFNVSALTGEGVPDLLADVEARLPEGPPYYPKDELSEHPVRFFVSELIREQIFLQYEEEIPYSCTVEVTSYEEGESLDRIHAEVIVNRQSQKGILIGKGGTAIKKLGTAARQGIQELVGKNVFLDLHVKVREKWRENDPWVRRLGYGG